jgi:FkbM family methyltransferase
MATAWRDAARKALPEPLLTRVRAARWGLRHLQHRLRWLASGRRGAGIGLGRFDGRWLAYRLHSVDTAVLHHSFANDIFFAAIPDLTLADDAVIVDVGAHIGTFALLASEKALRGRVYAIEASRETFNLLAANVELNRRSNIELSHLALAGHDGPITLHHDPDGNYGHSITKSLSASHEVVPGVTLERYLNDRALADVAVAKFNCEGAEFPILLTASPATLRRIAVMVILYHCDLAGQPVTALIDHLHAAGFSTRRREESADRGWIIAERR